MGGVRAPLPELEEVPMPIVGGLDIHRKQITFDYLDTVTGQVQRGQITPADREHLRAWLARFAGLEDVGVRGRGVHRVAVRGGGAGRGRRRGASGRACRYRVRPRPQAARQDRQDRLPASADAAGRGPAAGVLDPARPHPGVPGAARAVSRPAGRAHRLGAADPRGAVPPGRPGAGRRARCAPRRAWPRCGPLQPPGCRRPGSCRSPPPWRCSRPWRPGCTSCGTS